MTEKKKTIKRSPYFRFLTYLFITVTLISIFAAIATSTAELYLKLLLGGVFSLADAVAFSYMLGSEEQREETYTIIPPSTNNALPSPTNVSLPTQEIYRGKTKTVYYCPQCKTFKKYSETWQMGVGTMKHCKLCNTPTIDYEVPEDVQGI